MSAWCTMTDRDRPINGPIDEDTREAIITIDGPAASGKSSVARLVAARLEVPFVSSGLLYRGATYLALDKGCDAAAPAEVMRVLDAHDVRLVPDVEGNHLLIDGRDRTARLHTDEVDDAVSEIATHPEIRTWVNARLREIRPPFVVEGRDMGTVVFPNARHKFYLTAPAQVRARRRLGERSADLEAVTAALQRRDEMDAGRLARAEDASYIDTGGLGLEQVVDEVLKSVPRSAH
jgi:cytidylate kinase